MIDKHKIIVATLNKILPTHYEMVLTSKTATPCISYMELSNIEEEQGDTLGYSRIVYQIKVWGTDIATIQQYAAEVDKALRAIGFKRSSSTELYDNASAMIQKIMSYECLTLEKY